MAQQVTRAKPAKISLELPTALPAKAPAVIDVTDDEFDVGIDFITIGILAVKVAPRWWSTVFFLFSKKKEMVCS